MTSPALNDGELVAQGVSHQYAAIGAPTLRRIDVNFKVGEMVAISGPSGSGKSTLLSILGLLFPPTSGTIIVCGVVAWDSRRRTEKLRREGFAWVLQNSACLEARSALDNVAMPIMARGGQRSIAEREASDALQRVGLADRLTSMASQLSGGELQRMTVARALVSDTVFVLADEPSGQLDAANSLSVASALRSCAANGKGVVVATHDAALADECDRTVVLRDGAVES